MGPTQILHLDQPRSGSHLLQRILSRQPKLTKLDHPFSQSRGKQVDWLLSEDYAEGMNGELNAAFDAEVEKGIRQWEQKLAQASRCVSVSCHDEHGGMS